MEHLPFIPSTLLIPTGLYDAFATFSLNQLYLNSSEFLQKLAAFPHIEHSNTGEDFLNLSFEELLNMPVRVEKINDIVSQQSETTPTDHVFLSVSQNNVINPNTVPTYTLTLTLTHTSTDSEKTTESNTQTTDTNNTSVNTNMEESPLNNAPTAPPPMLLIPLAPAPAPAPEPTTLSITNFGDGLSGTLRAAIIATNHGTNTLPINLGIGTYTLSLTSGAQNEQYGDLNITSNITIRGVGAEQTTIDAQSIDRLFHIMPGVTVTLENMRLEGGDATQGGSNGKGGALFVEGGTLILNNVFITNNVATFGGGLATEGGSISTNNHTSFNFNQATTDGGGIYSLNSVLALDNVGISSNIAGNNGGGVALLDSTSHFIDASNISFNLSHLAGGGIFSNNSTITIEDATLVVGSQVVNDPFAPFGASTLTPGGIGGGIAAINGSTVSMDASSLSATDTYQSFFGFNLADEGTGVFANHNNWSWDGISTFNSVVGPGIGPVVLSFNDNQIDLISPENSHVYIQSEKGSYQMGWVGSDEGVLVYNPTHQDTLTSLTQIAFTWYLPGARTDLQGLSAFDSNHDAQLSNADLDFHDFSVWFKGSLFSLDQLSITSISLNSTGQSQTVSGNVIHGLTTYQTSDGQSHVAADVSLSIHDILPASSPLPPSPSLVLTAPPTVSDPVPPHETPHPAFG